MSSKIHNHGKEIRIREESRIVIDELDDDFVKATYWRSKNPKVSKIKCKELKLSNRFDFGKEAPKRFKNFAWLRKDKKIKDFFGVRGKEE